MVGFKRVNPPGRKYRIEVRPKVLERSALPEYSGKRFMYLGNSLDRTNSRDGKGVPPELLGNLVKRISIDRYFLLEIFKRERRVRRREVRELDKPLSALPDTPVILLPPDLKAKAVRSNQIAV